MVTGVRVTESLQPAGRGHAVSTSGCADWGGEGVLGTLENAPFGEVRQRVCQAVAAKLEAKVRAGREGWLVGLGVCERVRVNKCAKMVKGRGVQPSWTWTWSGSG